MNEMQQLQCVSGNGAMTTIMRWRIGVGGDEDRRQLARGVLFAWTRRGPGGAGPSPRTYQTTISQFFGKI